MDKSAVLPFQRKSRCPYTLWIKNIIIITSLRVTTLAVVRFIISTDYLETFLHRFAVNLVAMAKPAYVFHSVDRYVKIVSVLF